MRAVDTNVLVRLIARDNPRQVASAEAFIASGAWISILVLAETMWVVRSIYGLDTDDIATAVEMILNQEKFVVEDPELVVAALERFRKRPALGFSDCLVFEIARKSGHLPLGTFDRQLGKIPGVETL